MIVIYGNYKFRKNEISNKKIHCLNCKKTQSCSGEEFFDVIHIFGIPLIPLGSKTKLICSVCKRDPSVNKAKQENAQAIVLGMLMCVILLITFFAPIATGITLWGIRLFILLFIIIIFASATQ